MFSYPARAALLTGRLPVRNGFYTDNEHARNGKKKECFFLFSQISSVRKGPLVFHFRVLNIISWYNSAKCNCPITAERLLDKIFYK